MWAGGQAGTWKLPQSVVYDNGGLGCISDPAVVVLNGRRRVCRCADIFIGISWLLSLGKAALHIDPEELILVLRSSSSLTTCQDQVLNRTCILFVSKYKFSVGTHNHSKLRLQRLIGTEQAFEASGHLYGCSPITFFPEIAHRPTNSVNVKVKLNCLLSEWVNLTIMEIILRRNSLAFAGQMSSPLNESGGHDNDRCP